MVENTTFDPNKIISRREFLKFAIRGFTALSIDKLIRRHFALENNARAGTGFTTENQLIALTAKRDLAQAQINNAFKDKIVKSHNPRLELLKLELDSGAVAITQEATYAAIGLNINDSRFKATEKVKAMTLADGGILVAKLQEYLGFTAAQTGGAENEATLNADDLHGSFMAQILFGLDPHTQSPLGGATLTTENARFANMYKIVSRSNNQTDFPVDVVIDMFNDLDTQIVSTASWSLYHDQSYNRYFNPVPANEVAIDLETETPITTCKKFTDRGGVVVASVGNEGERGGHMTHVSSSFKEENLIRVGALKTESKAVNGKIVYTPKLEPAKYSSWLRGANELMTPDKILFAPGHATVYNVETGKAELVMGTSPAQCYVASLMQDMLALDKTLTGVQARQIIFDTADLYNLPKDADPDLLAHYPAGYKVVNAAKALDHVKYREYNHKNYMPNVGVPPATSNP